MPRPTFGSAVLIVGAVVLVAALAVPVGLLVAGTSPGGPNTAPPAPPRFLSVTSVGASTAGLRWQPPTKGPAVHGYLVFRGSAEVAKTSALTYTATHLASATNYDFAVVAYDGADNRSAPAVVVAKTLRAVSTARATPAYDRLVFHDEFTGANRSAPDPKKWQVLGGSSPPRWGSECFADDRDHIALDGNGNLVATATYSSTVPCRRSGRYLSGGVTTGSPTSGVFHYRYGRAEARIKVPCQSGTGMWPAWWQDGPNWPVGGEIDSLEITHSGGAGMDAQTTLHGPTSSGGTWHLGFDNQLSDNRLWCRAYHVYGNIWSPGEIQFTIDGTVVHTVTAADMQPGWIWPFDSYAERLVLDLQVDGWGGTVRNSTLPQSMLVDWVKVWQGAPTADTHPPTVPQRVSANAVDATHVVLAWSASRDNVAVTGYRIYRDNTLLATVGAVTSYTDASAAPATSYTYRVIALDATGHRSARSAPVTLTTPRGAPP